MEGSASHSEVRTFLIADVRGYTHFTLEHGDEAAAQLAARFADLTEEVVSDSGGEVIELRGDEALAAFVSSRQALRAAVELQRRFGEESGDTLPLKAGIGLDVGEAFAVKGGYRGAALNLAARLCSLAGVGEVLASETVSGIARKVDGLAYADRGQVQLKGFADPVRVVQILAEDHHDLPTQETSLVGIGPRRQQLPIGGFLGALPAGPLVGRDEEVGRISQAIESATRGGGRLILLAGEPGAGKTRLAQEATLALRNRGFIVAAGSSFEPRQSVPYYPFLDVLASLYGAVSSTLRWQSGRRWPYLGYVLPEAGIPVPDRSGGAEEQEWLLRAIVSFVQGAAEEEPIAILLDDLQWADEASLELLQRLAVQTRGHRVLLLGTYRDGEVQRPGATPRGSPTPLERTLRDLHRAGVTELISVRRLEEDGTRALIAASFDEELSEEFVRFVHRQAEGNPFFTHEILHALVERGDVYRRNDQWKWSEIDEAEVPESVRSVIGERLSRLQPATQEMLGEASILGQTFHFDELQALGTHAEEDVEGALDEAMHRGIVRETKTDHYVFNHALIQGVLYAELSSRRKRRLHLAAAEALESLPEQRRQGREAELAWHFVEGDDRERALRYSLLAGNRAEDVFAHHEATQHYRAARDLARELEDTTLLCEAWRKLGAVLHLTGRYDAALGALKEALQLARQAHDIDGEIEVVIHLLRYAPERGRHGDVLPWIESILPRLEDDATSPRKLAFFNAYAYFLVQSLQFEEGLQMAEKAVAMAATLGDEHALARAKVSLGHLLLWHGRAAEAEGVLKPAAEYLEQVGDLPEAMRAASLLAQISWFAGDQPAATAWRERSLWLAHQVGNAAQAVYETCMLGYQHLRLGDMEVAWEVGRRALAEAQKMDQSTMTGSPLGLLATLSLTQGKWDDLDRFACEMISLSDHSDEPWWRRHGERTLALRDLLDERADRALARLEPLLLGTELDMQEQALYLPVLAEAYLQAGNLHQARQVLDTSLALHGRAMRGMLAETLCVHAKLLLANGELAGAETVLNDLLDLTRSLPYPFVEAQALVACGQLEAMRGSPGAARQRLEEALTIFRRLAAQPFVEQAERAMAQLAPTTVSEV